MTQFEFLCTLILGFLTGWTLHSIVLQIAYHRGIIEYKGTKHDQQRLP